MLARDSWAKHTQSLAPGRWHRVEHDCGPGRVLRVSCEEDGSYHAWCFRCGEGDSFRKEEALADKLARLERLQQGDRHVAGAAVGGGLPVPLVRDVSEWPAGAALWLYKAGLSKADIGRHGFYYHAESDRVVLPVPDPVLGLDKPIFWQARAWRAGRQPKYLGPTPRPANLLARWGRAMVPTLTEDILSAVKIGDVAEGWAVLGTKVSDHMLTCILKRGGKVNVWLDPDAAGLKAAAKIIKQLRGFGIDTRQIHSARDPKLHSRADIKELLWEHTPSSC